MTPDLSILRENQEALLLAEMAAWLHDMGKCSDEMIEKQASDCPALPRFQSNNDYKIAFSDILNGSNQQISLLDERVTRKELVEKGGPSAIKNNSIQSLLIKYLGRCHAAAHIEKEGQADVKQTVSDTRLSSPFGHETEPLADLTKKLKALPFNEINNREKFLEELKIAFQNAPGDTERPINEVDLWDWSSIVAALYKSALAGALLGNKPEPNDLKWRLLAIRIDSERLLGDVAKIPVLLARKEWISNGLDKVKKLIEEEYPLGNEVYRDENGSIFTVPDINNLLKIKNKDKSLEEMLTEKLGFEGEIVVTPSLSNPWWGQNPSGRPDPNKDEIPPIGKILKEKPYSSPDPETLKKLWDDAKGNPEICTISWIHPQGPTEKGFQRKASDYWADRVTGRAEEWLGKLDKTIWIDEVADSNGRICLIAGKLGIEDWLSLDGHIKTLLVRPPNSNPDSADPKTPSFARIRRIWETTKTFWENVEQDFQKTVGLIGPRLKIIGNFKQENSVASPNNAYEAELKGIKFSIFYTDNNEYIIIENLQRLAQKMRASSEELETYSNSIEYIKNHLDGKILNIYHSESKNREKPIGQLTISQVEPEPTSFVSTITILLEPGIFMAIIPANRALELAKNVKEKYERKMGKVRNRLPITLGMVFAKSHTPLAALMDAGRRMLSFPNRETTWILNATHDSDIERILNFNNGITWQVPIKMGDGSTEDIWYPYFYVNGTPDNRSTAFQGPGGWLVHVKELKKGDEVKITPSKFDFDFLDTASRRFEVSYDDNGNRRDQMKTERPYLLEELDYFERWWNILSGGLARSQIKNVISLIETKREEWLSKEGDDAFENFVHDALHNANWKDGIPTEKMALEKAAIKGKLKNIVELYMDILKVPIGGEKQQEVFE